VATLRRLFLHRSVPYVIFATGCALSLAAHVYLSDAATAAAEMRAHSEFLADAQHMRRQIQTGVTSYVEIVRAAAVLLSSETEINGAEFTRFVSRLQVKKRYPAIEGIGYAQCVPARDVARVVRALALDGTPLRLWPESTAAERCPVVFFGPGPPAHAAIRGFDLAADARIRNALHSARDSGQPSVSRHSDRTATDRRDEKLFVFIPVYRTATARTVEARRAAIVGYVFSPLDAMRLFEHIVELTAPGLAFEVFEGAIQTPDAALGGSPVLARARYESSESVDVSGRTWLVNVKLLGTASTVVPEEARRAVVGGLLISFMLFLVTRAQARAWESAARHEAELRTSAEALREREAQASAANRAKDEFLATLSHELRTPLNVVLGWVGMLRLNALSHDRATQALEIIERNARQQAELIDDLLDVSRIITGKLRLNLRSMSFAPVVAAVTEALRPSAEAKGVTLQLGSLAEPSTIMGDPDRLRQTVWNLLSNAVKFTPPGGTVSVELTSKDSRLRLAVRDTGIGISSEFLPYVFERFMQADSSTTRTHSGVGLGLAIVRELIELHGGTVEAQSAGQNQGATFVISLPAASAVAPHAKVAATTRADSPGLGGVHVLVIDDDPNTLEMLTEALEGGGAEVTAADSARRALEALEAQRPDVIVSDIAMPGEDGLWLMHRIRALPGQVACTPAVALTALARKDDRARALKAGFQIHLAKPVRLDDLKSVVAALAAERREAGGAGRVSAC
jgi:signal transduction histidine kinase/ActR/RegA family two-component response regulator